MSLNVELEQVRVDTGCNDEEGRLVTSGGRLVAVLVQLAELSHHGLTGCWFLESGFGRCREESAPVFADLDDATAWIRARLAS